MADILIIFGSKSDEEVYNKLLDYFDRKKIDYEFTILSAHRNPDELKKAVQNTDAKLIVAGAGLSAALPGVIASYTEIPIIGIPIDANYSGLDALLSVHQMPKGIPVLGVGVDCAEEAARNVELVLKGVQEIVLVKHSSKAAEKAKEKLDELKVDCSVVSSATECSEKVICINFVDIDKAESGKLALGKGITINVPVKKDAKAGDVLKLLELTKHGLWVGLNRGENAAVAAARLLRS